MNKPDLAEIYYKAVIYQLDFPHKVDADEMHRIYNGVGAEWMPDAMRNFLDGISVVLLPAVLIHDIDYEYGNGTLLDFQMASKRLEENGIKCADAEYAWYHPMRYVVRRQAKLYRKICDFVGLEAYMSAVEQSQKNKNSAPKEVQNG